MIIREVTLEELEGFNLIDCSDIREYNEFIGVEEGEIIIAVMKVTVNAIDSIEVLKDYRDKGYGKALVEHLQSEYDFVVAKDFTTESIPFWLSMGFVQRGIDMVWEYDYKEQEKVAVASLWDRDVAGLKELLKYVSIPSLVACIKEAKEGYLKELSVGKSFDNIILRKIGNDLILIVPGKEEKKVFVTKVKCRWDNQEIREIEKVLDKVYCNTEMGDTFAQTTAMTIETIASLAKRNNNTVWSDEFVRSLVIGMGVKEIVRNMVVLIHDVIIEDDCYFID